MLSIVAPKLLSIGKMQMLAHAFGEAETGMHKGEMGGGREG